ncbi:MAG: hypothetical protein GY870_09970 [archaeon]|nr:hypothetical protein [archaeon]
MRDSDNNKNYLDFTSSSIQVTSENVELFREVKEGLFKWLEANESIV